MPALGRFLIQARIPFAMEKPCGTSLAEVRALATLARAANAFAAIPFVFRYCGLVDALRDEAPGEAIQYIGFKFVGQLEACDSLRQTKAPFGLTTQSIREPRWFAVERGESER